MFASVGCDDLLPRAAPKPSDMTESVVAPTVPEVSLLQENVKPASTNSMPMKPAIKSYSEFKKAVLPRVTFTSPGLDTPAITANKDLNSNKTDLYPLRSAISATTLSSTNSNNNIVDTNTSVKPSLAQPNNNLYYRRSLESAITYPSQNELNLINNNFALQQLHQQQRRSIERIMQNTSQSITSKNDILTICAGTQTDVSSTNAANETITEALKNLASKDAVAELTLRVVNMQRDQERLIQICELLLLNSQPKPSVTNGAIIDVQFENETDQYAIMQNLKQKQLQDALQYQTPVTKPAAQSTAYHANLPMQNCADMFSHEKNLNPINNLEKRSSDRSLVMNELAMKYLTNEKLTEMMKEVNLASPTQEQMQTPLRNIGNIDKGVCDLSNASYKYLKKYRLLPEETNGYNSTSPKRSPQHDYTKSPIILKQNQQNYSPLTRQPPQQYSPYQGPSSPMYGTGKTDHIDLDNIRKQPKFM